MYTEETATKKKVKQSSITTVAPGLAHLRIVMVNVYFVFEPTNKDNWILIDCGMGNCARTIRRAADEYFGVGTRPSAIILTHGHFDHIGGLPELAEMWDVPVYVHRLEFPYLTGKSSYPPPDPSVGGGVMPLFSPLFKRTPINIEERLVELREGQQLPEVPGWRVIDTPGHSPGHVSFFRESDKTLIAGDAFVTVKQESAIAVVSQKQKVHGPPAYFTIDWYQAERSVQKLADLRPELAATGHGFPMNGNELQTQLDNLVEHFVELAIPPQGRYIHEPVITNEHGVVSIPEATSNPYKKIIISAAIVGIASFALYKFLELRHEKHANVKKMAL